MIRERKQWTEQCTHCHGTGYVAKRTRFNLWTPEEWAKGIGPDYKPIPLDPKHDVPSNAYICIAMAGASIFETCREAVDIAQIIKRPVVFEFNGAIAICRPGADPTAVGKEWWKRCYGRTYEYDMEHR